MIDKKEVIVPLLDVESSWLLKDENGIVTITFYRGDRVKAIATIRARMKEMVIINPWLVGQLIGESHKKIQLVYPEEPSDDVIERLFHPESSQILVGSQMPYRELSESVKPAIVKKGFKIINKPDLITHVAIVSDMDCPKDGFALIFSMSHMVVDGSDYYKVMNSLLSTTPVSPLEVRRNQEASNKVIEAIGKKVDAFYHSIPFSLNLIVRYLFGKKTKSYAFYVDYDKINIIKNKSKKDGVEYVSSNDILVSSFAKTVRAYFCIMAVNFKDRIKGIDKNDIGNYEGGLLLDWNTYNNPSNIRKVLQNGMPFLGTTMPIPGFKKIFFSTICLVSNWSSFANNFILEECEQYLHLPIYALETFPTDTALIFNPKPGKLAVIYFAKTVSRDELLLNCELGESVSTKIFQ